MQKPIYGIQHAGRRLQRMLFDWFLKEGFTQHDKSGPCMFSCELPEGEILTIAISGGV